MNTVFWTHITYLVASIMLTIWVARTLFKNSRIFLVDTFRGNAELADSVNHLLVVGFYLINIGYVTLALQYGAKPRELAGAIEVLSTKVGLGLLVLGAMHFFNLAVFSKMRNRSLHPELHSPDSAQANKAAIIGPDAIRPSQPSSIAAASSR